MFKNTCSLVLCGILLTWFTGSSVLAADQPVNHWKLDSMNEACALGASIAVGKELKLTGMQSESLASLAEKWKGKLKQFRRENKKATTEQLTKLDSEFQAEVLKLITPVQFARLRQIQFQCVGVAQVLVLHEESPKLFQLTKQGEHDLLALDIDYERRMAKIDVDMAFSNTKALLEKRNAGERPEIVALRKERNAKALALLTAEQKNTWETISGEPFVGELKNAKGKRVHPKLEALP
jgi:hypothetical protein